MRQQLVFGLMIVGLFAGCVGGGAGPEASPSASSQAPLAPSDVDPNSDFGVVQGTIVDDETQPVANAEVALQGTEVKGASDANGLFVLRDVPPGKYVLLVGALGYESTARNIEVQAGQLSPVSIVLHAVAVAATVYPEIIHFSGYFDCAFATPVWISMCSYPYTAAVLGVRDGTCDPLTGDVCAPGTGVDPTAYGVPKDLQDNRFRYNFTVGKDVGQLQAELTWTPSSAAATVMGLSILCGDYDPVWDECFGKIRYADDVHGKSPVKAVVDGKDFFSKGAGKGKYDLAKNDHIWVMNYVGLPFASASDPTTNQVALAQRYDIWDTVFHNGPGPDDWTVLRDG